MKLPQSVQEIADVIGRDQALYLIGQMPASGSRSWRVCFYVPKRIKPDHQLVHVLGWRNAQKMVRHFGGEILQTSNCNFLHREFRNREIWRMHAEGMATKDIAEAVDLSEYHVRDLLRGKPHQAATNDNQPARRTAGAI